VIAILIVPCLAACGPTIQTGLDDAQLTMRVKTALLNDPELGTQPIEVQVNGGTVRLLGHVEHADRIAQAERLVRTVDGVRDVDVELETAPREPTSRDQPGRLPSLAPLDTSAPLRLFALGVAGTLGFTPGDDLGNGVSFGPIVRLRPRNGWGPSVGFGWTRTPLRESRDLPPGLADVIVRPVMAGVEYGVTRGSVATAVSIVGGYAFNSLKVDAGKMGPVRAIAVDNGLALRAGVGLWYDVTPRVGLNVFAGYRMARPRVTFASDSAITTPRVNADTVILSVGVAYWVF